MVGGSVRLRGAFLFAASSSLAPVAHAGAWSVADGEQQWFATVSRESGDFGQAWRADDFTEVGIGDGWQVVTKLESQISIGETFDDRSGFRLGVQKAFAIDERTSVSLLASYLGGESLDGVECAGGGYEVRAAIGTSFSLGGRNGFVNVEAGHRARDDCERNVSRSQPGWSLPPPGTSASRRGRTAGPTAAPRLSSIWATISAGWAWGSDGARKSPGFRGEGLGRFGQHTLLT